MWAGDGGPVEPSIERAAALPAIRLTEDKEDGCQNW